MQQYLVDIRNNRLPARVGNKARNLHALLEKGFRVPNTFVLAWDAYDAYLHKIAELIPQIRTELGRKLDPDRLYAVRSSANVEDGAAFSFAGQFTSVLNVRGIDAVVEAVLSVWDSACADNVQVYLDKLPKNQRVMKMAVIIQEMVSPVFSGVAFSKNPVTGADETVIEAVEGTGDALVQGGQTPDRWIHKWGEWVTVPQTPKISIHVAQKVVEQVRQIAQTFKRDVDIEWVYDGENVNIVQLRDITSLSQVEVYSSRIAKDMLPGMIKPLVWSLNVPMVNAVWVGILTEMIGKNDLDPMTLAKPFYYRAYFNMTVLGKAFNQLGLPSEALDMMMGLGPGGMRMPSMRMHSKMVLLAPRLAAMIWGKLQFHKRIESELPKIESELGAFQPQRAAEMTDGEIVADVQRLYGLTQRAAYLNIVGPLLMMVYNGLLNQRLKDAGIDPQQFDLMHGMDELSDYEPGRHLQALNAQYQQLDEAVRDRIDHCSFEEFLQMEGIAPFQRGVQAFLDRFGHLSDSGNDISVACWRETPDLIKKMILVYAPIGQTSRQICLSDVPRHKIKRPWLLYFLHRRARSYRLYREHISFVYTKTYGTFRPYWLELGERMVRRGLLRERGDVFYLYMDEARAALDGKTLCDYAAVAAERKAEMAAMKDLAMPVLLYGDTPPPVLGITDNRLNGIPASRGVYTGRARVIRSLSEFHKLEPGDVLVIPYSDVGWTPLFARAGGVIAESGGLLSHSSIIAREYQIPAVVSVADATLLQDNTLVTVDGFKGEILIHRNGDDHGRIDHSTGSQPAAQAV